MYNLETVATRAEFGRTLFELAQNDERIVAVGGDSIGSFGLTPMQKALPRRVINTGIAEQNAMAISAGMASEGYKVFMSGFAPFVTMRSVEEFRTFICYPNLNVKVIGGMGGLSAAQDGVTHMGQEDYGIMRMFPNAKVLVPADATAVVEMTKVLANTDGPAYMRLMKGPVYKVFDHYSFEIGKANLMRAGSDVTLISNGAVFYRALLAADALSKIGIGARVLEMPCIKPIDRDAIIAAARETGAIVTVEDHTEIGGLGSAVAEVVVQSIPIPMRILGIHDTFAESGDHYLLMDKYGMSVDAIVDAAKAVIAQKRS